MATWNKYTQDLKVGDLVETDGIKWEIVYVDDIRTTAVNENGQIAHAIRTDADTSEVN